MLAASLLRSVSQWVLARLQRSTSQALLVKFKESLPFSKRQVWEAASLLASLRVKIQTGKLCVELSLVLGHIQVSARINPHGGGLQGRNQPTPHGPFSFSHFS